jgi:hypothetical protein
MRTVAKNAWPTKTTRGRIEALAQALEISRRSCYAYVANERRVPEDVERKFIALFGEVADDGWRTIELYRLRSKEERAKKAPKLRGGLTKAQAATAKSEWLDSAIRASSVLSQDILGHVLGWESNPITYGQLAMIEEGLDEDEARRKHPNNFDVLAMSDDVVAICKACDLIGGVDTSVREINGLVFRVSCRTNSYRVSE